jgi:hypothetical protein
MVQAFRRTESPLESVVLKLRGLAPEARYLVTSLDPPGRRELGGKELLEEGLPVTLPEQPGAVVFVYKRAKP